MAVSDTNCEVVLRFQDGVESRITVPGASTVLEAALEQSAPVLYQCRSGSCSSCLAQLTEGEARMMSGAASVLTASEVAAGARLLCRTQALGDCAFALGYESTASGSGPRKAFAFVDSVERIAPDVVRLKLELADGSWIDFKPGQFVQVAVPGTTVRRSYSISSTPADLPALELLIRLLPGGAMSTWLEEGAHPDALVELEGPFGNFFLRDKVRAPHIMIAGGTGLAPMMSMIDTIRARPGHKPQMLLSFGCASEAGLFFREELELRGLWIPSLEVRLSVDKGTPGPSVLVGNPVAAVTAADAQDPDTVAYLCGPPGLIEAGRARLAALGLAPPNIHAEQFVASE